MKYVRKKYIGVELLFEMVMVLLITVFNSRDYICTPVVMIS